MSTIAYKSGVLAGDTRIILGDSSEIQPGHVRKVFKLSNGCLIGFAGDLSKIQEVMRELKRHPDELSFSIDDDDELTALLVYPDGVVKEFDGSGWLEVNARHYAIGSGYIPASVAMECGQTAAQSIKIAMKFDGGTGGKVQTVSLDKSGRRAKARTTRPSE